MTHSFPTRGSSDRGKRSGQLGMSRRLGKRLPLRRALARAANVHDQNFGLEQSVVHLVAAVDVSAATLVRLPSHLGIIAQDIEAAIEAGDVFGGLFLAKVRICVADDLLNLSLRLAA